jgi:hypothetical protein
VVFLAHLPELVSETLATLFAAWSLAARVIAGIENTAAFSLDAGARVRVMKISQAVFDRIGNQDVHPMRKLPSLSVELVEIQINAG